MKKKILVLAAALMMFMGIVSASSINGDYKGNPIVKVMSNGKQLETDEVPAVILDGHTVVPISTLRQLGASVTWDAYGYSVDVRFPSSEPPLTQTPVQSSNNDVAKLKAYSTAENIYSRLSVVGDSISQVATYTIAAADFVGSNKEQGYIQLSENQLSFSTKLITDVTNEINSAYNNLKYSDVDISDVKNIIDDYALVIRTYGLSLNGVKSYNAKTYNDNVQNGMQQLNLIRERVNSKYLEFHGKIQNF